MSDRPTNLIELIAELRHDHERLRARVLAIELHWAAVAATGAPLDSRESGGSLPAAGHADNVIAAALRGRGPLDPPVLNKSGGSDVDGGDAECVHDWRPYFAHLVCTKCGAAQRGAAGG